MSILEAKQLYNQKQSDIQEIIDELDIGSTIESVTNPFSGQSVNLNPTEVALYDYLRGCEALGNFSDSGVIKDYFIKNNPKAYSILID